MEKYIIVSAKENNFLYIIDTEKKQLGYTSVNNVVKDESFKIPGTTFDLNDLRYKNDDTRCNLNNSLGTLFCTSKKYGLVGILRVYGKSIALLFIDESTYNSSSDNIYILNKNDSVFDVDNPTEFKLKLGDKKIQVKAISDIRQCKFASLAKLCGCTPEETESNNVENTEHNVENTEHNVENTEHSVNASITDSDIHRIANEVYNKLTNVSDSEKICKLVSWKNRLSLKENELNKKEKELNEKLSIVNGYESDKLSGTTYLEVSNIDGDDTTVSDTTDDIHSNIIYNNYVNLLKLLKTYDRITIPYNVYKKLSVFVKKQLYSNMDYSEYRVIAKIKEEKASDKCIICIIDVNENAEYARILVLNEYSKDTLSDNVILNYEMKYNEWKNSFSNVSIR